MAVAKVPLKETYKIYQGDDVFLPAEESWFVLKENNVAIDIASHTFKCHLRDGPARTDALIATGTVVKDSDTSTGKYRAEFTSAQTAILTGGSYYYGDIQVTGPDGVIKTPIEFKFSIRSDKTV